MQLAGFGSAFYRRLTALAGQWIDLVQNFWGGIRALLFFLKTGNNSSTAFHFLVANYCRTRGASNEFVHQLLRRVRPQVKLLNTRGILGDISGSYREQCLGQLAQDGYFVFPNALPAEVVARLSEQALKQPCRPYPRPASAPETLLFPERSKFPIAPTYHFAEAALVKNPDIQNIISDYSIWSLAQGYLQCAPILDMVTSWWSCPTDGKPVTEAATSFHFDMDRLKWLKFIIYLTDVGLENGPHVFVRKSHRLRSKPKELLRQGYARIGDEELRRHYPAQDILQLPAPQGTVLAVDTSAFHKGTPLLSGLRLVLELEFTSSLFGVPFSKTELTPVSGSNLEHLVKAHPQLFSKFTL